MPDKTLRQLIDEQQGNPDLTAPLPTELPEVYDDPTTMPVLSDPSDNVQQLHEYRARVAALQHGVDPDLMAGVGLKESRLGMNTVATDPNGKRYDKGVMQVTQNTAKSLGYDRNDPDQNLRAGATYLKQLIDKNPNNLGRALRGYPAPKDRATWIPEVLSNAEKSRQNRENRMPTYEESLADYRASKATQPPQEAPLNAPGSQITNVNPEVGVGQPQPGLGSQIASTLIGGLGGPLGQATFGQEQTPEAAINRIISGLSGATKGSGGEFIARQTSRLTEPIVKSIIDSLGLDYTKIKGEREAGIKTAEEAAPAQDIIGQLMGILTPGGPMAKGAELVGKGAGMIPKIGKAIAPVLVGAEGAGQYEAMQPEATLESVGKAVGYGAVGGAVLKGLGETVKVLANKAGDINLGKWNVGKFVNEKFGATSSLESLAAKNRAAYQETEAKLQETLDKYAGNMVKPPKGLTPKVVDSLAKEAEANMAPQEDIDVLNYLSQKLKVAGELHPSEMNVIKRALYTESYSASGKMKGSVYAKNTGKLASEVKSAIESATGKEVVPLNQLESQHMALTKAIDKAQKGNQSASLWSIGMRLAPLVTGTGAAATYGGPIAGVAAAIPAIASTSVPTFTGLGAAGKAIENPDLIKILSTILPQYLQNKGE